MGVCGCMNPKPNCTACGNYVWAEFQQYYTNWNPPKNVGSADALEIIVKLLEENDELKKQIAALKEGE